jgi:hypothetical protein
VHADQAPLGSIAGVTLDIGVIPCDARKWRFAGCPRPKAKVNWMV